MLFLATYHVDLENLDTAMAKRLEWDEIAPEGFRIVCEYAVHGQPSPFGGFLVFETDDVAHLNLLITYYGRSVRMDIRPCSNVLTAITMTQQAQSAKEP